MEKALTAVTCVACLAFAASWGVAWSADSRVPATYMYILMVDTVGPAANALWATTGGAGLDDQDWDRVKQATARLRESGDLVSFGGTTCKDIERARSNEWKFWAAKFSDTVSLPQMPPRVRTRPLSSLSPMISWGSVRAAMRYSRRLPSSPPSEPHGAGRVLRHLRRVRPNSPEASGRNRLRFQF